MAKLMEMLRNAQGRLSIGRVASVVTVLLWWATWIYTLAFKIVYGHFDTVTIAMLIMFFVVLMGKAVDSKLVTIKGDEKK